MSLESLFQFLVFFKVFALVRDRRAHKNPRKAILKLFCICLKKSINVVRFNNSLNFCLREFTVFGYSSREMTFLQHPLSVSNARIRRRWLRVTVPIQ